MLFITRSLFGRRHAVVWLAIVFVLALLLFADPVMAQRRGRGASSRLAKANAARKQQEIAQLQKQLDGSRKLLDSVTAKGSMTQAQIASARQAALAARDALNETEDQDNEMHQKLHSIETGILEAQSDDSEFAKSVDAMHASRRALDTEMHRILRRPPPDPDEDEATRLSELAHLTADERDTLSADSRYAEKKEALYAAIETINTVKMRLYKASDEWKKAKEEHHRMEQDVAQGERSVQGAANDSFDARSELRTLAEIAASARASISQAESRLNALGAKPKAPTPAKKPETKKNTP